MKTKNLFLMMKDNFDKFCKKFECGEPLDEKEFFDAANYCELIGEHSTSMGILLNMVMPSIERNEAVKKFKSKSKKHKNYRKNKILCIEIPSKYFSK